MPVTERPQILPTLAGLAVPVDSLELLPGNPRVGDVPAVVRSLAMFGQRKPIVARRSDRVVIAGNHTLLAARALNWPAIAVVWTDDDEATSLAFGLADNRTSELGGYDEAALQVMLAAVLDLDPRLLEAASWSEDDVTRLDGEGAVGEFPVYDETAADDVPLLKCPDCGTEFAG